MEAKPPHSVNQPGNRHGWRPDPVQANPAGPITFRLHPIQTVRCMQPTTLIQFLIRIRSNWPANLKLCSTSPLQGFKRECLQHAGGTLLLCALLGFGSLTNLAHADVVMGNQLGHRTADAEIQPPRGEDSADVSASSEITQLLQDLAPLPVLALGMLGLFWIRRHTADL